MMGSFFLVAFAYLEGSGTKVKQTCVFRTLNDISTHTHTTHTLTHTRIHKPTHTHTLHL